MVRPVKSKEDYPVRWIPVAEVRPVWLEAQRPLNMNKVREIAANFDPDGLGVIAVTEKNGDDSYHPLDGQHRAAALMLMGWGDQLIKAEIHTDVHTAKAAAERFLLLNNSRKPSALDSFRTAVTAGREREVAIAQIVKTAGFRIGIDSDSSRVIAAVSSLDEVYRRGPDVLRDVLNSVSAIWRDDIDSTNAMIIRGVGLLIHTYGAALDVRRFRERVGKKYTAGNLLAAARSQKNILGLNGPQSVLWTLAHCYNQGLRDDQKLEVPS